MTLKSKVTKGGPLKAITFNLKVNDAKLISDALTCCAAKKETRYYLMGVCLDSSKEGLLAVATDGHRMGRLRLKCVEKSSDKKGKEVWMPREKPLDDAFSVIAPNHFIKRLGSVGASAFLPEVCTLTISDGWIYYKDANEGFSSKLIDGTFPDWRKAYPFETEAQEALIAFNTAYLGQMSKALRKVHGRSSPIAIKVKSQTDAAILHSRRDVVDLTYALMPMRF